MSSFSATGSLVRLGVRLDRVRLVIWIVAISAITYATASAFRELYPTVESRLAFSGTLANTPALVALTGPPFDLSTIGGLTSWRIGGFGPVLLAIMGSLTANRHTRAEEEAGRLELIGSGSVGRFAPLAAALFTAFGASLIIGALVCLSLISFGESVRGSVALGLAFAGAGCMFASVAALAAQLTASARAAGGMAGSFIGVSFLLRAIGDSSGPQWLSWLSPIGWTQQVRPFSGERWWVFGLIAGFCTVLIGTAFALLSSRDLGSGLLPARPGPASAPDLDSAVKLGWRLHGGVMATWVIGLTIMGAAFGTIAESIGSLLEDNPQLKEIFEAMGGEQNLIDTFFASVMGIVGLLAGAYAIQATLRLRSEEVNLRAEPILATKVTRIEWIAGHLVYVVLGSCLVTVSAGVAAGLVHGLRTASTSDALAKLAGAGAVQLPAVFVLVGLTLALIGLAPRWTAAAWGVLVVSLVLKQLGPILQLDQKVLDLSPFTHVPQIPGQPFTWKPLLLLTAVALALTLVGALGFRRRDIG
jgi:ABC-2 type transport system permease protein